MTNEVKRGILSSTFHFPEIMLNVITSSVSDSLVRRTADVPEYKVMIPLRRDRLCRIRKAKNAHLRKAGTFAEGFGT